MIISQTLPAFWESYRELPYTARKAAQKAFEIWKENPFHPSLDLNVLNRKPTSGRSGSPWAIGLCAYLKVTRLRGFGLVIMPPTKGSSSSCAKVSNCMIAGDVPKAIRVLKESHLITDRRDTKVSSRRDLCEGCGETRIPTATIDNKATAP